MNRNRLDEHSYPDLDLDDRFHNFENEEDHIIETECHSEEEE